MMPFGTEAQDPLSLPSRMASAILAGHPTLQGRIDAAQDGAACMEGGRLNSVASVSR